MDSIKQIPQMLDVAREAERLALKLAAIEPQITGDLAEVPKILVDTCESITTSLELYSSPPYCDYPKQELLGNMAHDLAHIGSVADGANFMLHPHYSDAVTSEHRGKLKQMTEPIGKLHTWYVALRKEAYPLNE